MSSSSDRIANLFWVSGVRWEGIPITKSAEPVTEGFQFLAPEEWADYQTGIIRLWAVRWAQDWGEPVSLAFRNRPNQKRKPVA